MNLTTLKVKTDGWEDMPQEDCSCEDTANVRVIFRRHKEELLKYINKYDSVMGCIAWLTDNDILQALATKEFVSIIVQKEDFLRSDLNNSSEFKKNLNKLYNSLPSSSRHNITFRSLVHGLSIASDSTIEAIRCMGNHNQDKSSTFPRMHHKFLVFTNGFTEKNTNVRLGIWFATEEDCVWTGSYNLTKNATSSSENAIVLQSPTIVEAYMDEWSQIVALSEPLDWESTRPKPQWRIGS